jgi:hypothetical protein
MANKIEWGNPYTHEEHSRTSWAAEELGEHETCEWCGNRNGHGGLFQYNEMPKKFCCKDCYETYYGSRA